MPDTVPQRELMRSLGRLVRGLSAVFWGLPLALVVSVQAAHTTVFGRLGLVPPLIAQGLLLFGLFEMGHFQRQERIWMQALDRARLLALVNLGLSPFLHWSRMVPTELYFRAAVGVLAISGVLFVFNLNHTMQRLAAMLPDETLRLETRLFTTLNLCLLLAGLLFASAGIVADRVGWLAVAPLAVQAVIARSALLIQLLLILLPVALTMALLWRLKETILASVFGEAR